MPAQKTDEENPVAAYKALLRDMIDRRPSGTRLKIAQALGKHKSFVSQITNPAYAVPVPARHLTTIFEICHFSPEERRHFIEAYRHAHPGRKLAPLVVPSVAHSVTIEVPPLKDPQRQAELIDSIRLYAEHAIALAQNWEARAARPKQGGTTIEKAAKRRR